MQGENMDKNNITKATLGRLPKDIAKKIIDKVSINKSKLVEAFIKKGISL